MDKSERYHLDTLCERIRAHRKGLSMNQQQIAKASGVDGSVLSRFEHGKSRPGLKTLLKICKALNTTPDYLLGFSDHEAQNSQTYPLSECIVTGYRTLSGDIYLGLGIRVRRPILLAHVDSQGKATQDAQKWLTETLVKADCRIKALKDPTGTHRVVVGVVYADGEDVNSTLTEYFS